MADTQDTATLAHIADAMAALAERMSEYHGVQQNVLAVLGSLLETNQAQTEMLADILGAASQDAGPSPLAEALEALTSQVQQLDENQASLIVQITELPQAIGQQLVASLAEWPNPAPALP